MKYRNKSTLAFALLGSWTIAAAACGSEPDNVEKTGIHRQNLVTTSTGSYNGHAYNLYTALTTWENARTICESQTDHLVTINDSAEGDYVEALAAAQGINRIWIGMTDQVIDGRWRWVTEEPTLYTDWQSGEPSDMDGTEDYAAMYDGDWVDLPETATAAFVCERGGHSYRAVEKSVSWSSAEQDCWRRSGYLAAIGTSSENAILRDMLVTRNLSSAWIGLHDEHLEGTYRWNNGDALGYTSWATGEPDNSNNSDFVELNSDGLWNDLPSSGNRNYICEYGW